MTSACISSGKTNTGECVIFTFYDSDIISRLMEDVNMAICMLDRDDECLYECKGCPRYKTFHEDLESGWYEVESLEDEDDE